MMSLSLVLTNNEQSGGSGRLHFMDVRAGLWLPQGTMQWGSRHQNYPKGWGLLNTWGSALSTWEFIWIFNVFFKRDCNVFKVLLKSGKLYCDCQPNLGMNSEIKGINKNIYSI